MVPRLMTTPKATPPPPNDNTTTLKGPPKNNSATTPETSATPNNTTTAPPATAPKVGACYKQYFISNSLGIAHNISSNQLNHPHIGGVYGNNFLSGYEEHATSVSVGIFEGRVYLGEVAGIPFPVAWGRTGGYSEETKLKMARAARLRSVQQQRQRQQQS